MRAVSRQRFCCLLLVVAVTPKIAQAQLLRPNPASVGLQYSLQDSKPASTALVTVNSASTSPLDFTVTPSQTMGNWLRVARVSSSAFSSSDCPNSAGAYISFPQQLTANTRNNKLCIWAVRVTNIKGNYGGAVTLVTSGSAPVHIKVSLGVVPTGYLQITPLSSAKYDGGAHTLAFTYAGIPTAAQEMRVNVVDPNQGFSPSQYDANDKKAPLKYTVQLPDGSPADWVTIQPASPSTSPATLSINIDVSRAQAGQNLAQIDLSSGGQYQGSEFIRVQADITLPPAAFTGDILPQVLPYVTGVRGAPSKVLNINSTGAPITFTVSPSSDDGTGWLLATQSSSTTPAQIVISADYSRISTGRAPGDYAGKVKLAAANGTAVTIPVTLKIVALQVNPSAPASFSCRSGESALFDLSSSDPSVPISFIPSFSASWLSVTPAGMSTTPVRLTLTSAGCGSLDGGTYKETVTLLPANAASGPQIHVMLTISRPPTLSANPNSLPFDYDLSASSSELSKDLNVSSVSPVTFTASAQVDSNVPWLRVTPTTATTNATLKVSVDPKGLAASVAPYTGRIHFAINGVTQQLAVPVSLRVTGSAGGTKPTISKVVNSASSEAGTSPASWITIWGSNLSASTREWRGDEIVNGQLPSQLDGVSVTVNGKAASVEYISPNQINAVSPADDAVGPVQVQVTNSNETSAPYTAQLQSFSPAFFLFDGKYLAAQHYPDLSPVGKPGLVQGATPAKPGETIILYATGFGPTDPPTPADKLVDKVANTTNPVAIGFNGTTMTPSFAGLIPQFAALYQINVQVPVSAPNGDVRVVATVGGVDSLSNGDSCCFITVQN